MLNVIIKSSSRYPIRRKQIKETVQKTLETMQKYGDYEVEINICGDRKMKALKAKHLGMNETTDVLSFPLQGKEITSSKLQVQDSEEDFVEYPDTFIRLGNIYISYPRARKQANLHKITTDREVYQLVEHGMLHLLGIHHD